MPRVLFTLIILGLTIYAAVDCAQTRNDRVRNLPKLAWIVLIVLFPPVGAIVWLVAGRPKASAQPGRYDRRTGPRGPDDDPDFLRSI